MLLPENKCYSSPLKGNRDILNFSWVFFARNLSHCLKKFLYLSPSFPKNGTLALLTFLIETKEHN